MIAPMGSRSGLFVPLYEQGLSCGAWRLLKAPLSATFPSRTASPDSTCALRGQSVCPSQRVEPVAPQSRIASCLPAVRRCPIVSRPSVVTPLEHDAGHIDVLVVEGLDPVKHR